MKIDDELKTRLALETIDVTIIYVRSLELMLAGAYHAAQRGSDAEKDIGATYQNACEILSWLEQRAAALKGQADNTSAATTDTGKILH